MESFIIEGGHPLSGTITPQGAKNEALEVISATLLTSEPVTISNVPDILDVNNLIQLLKDIGVKVTSERKGVFTFQADQIDLGFLSSDEYIRKCSALRGSVLLMGPLLGRFGKASVAEPATRLVAADWTPTSSDSRISGRSSSATMSARCSPSRQSI